MITNRRLRRSSVVISRSKRRDAEAETVPSRWLNRLVNLMDGAAPAQQGGPEALAGDGGDGGRTGAIWRGRLHSRRRRTAKIRL